MYKTSCKTDPLTFPSVVFEVVMCVALGIGGCTISAVNRWSQEVEINEYDG